ncbi:MAG: hypothetical protein IJY20_05515 [Clostridia bacterium]|nr:hypothetical protein [Clostridia bacterium]
MNTTSSMLTVTDYIPADGKTDVADSLQRLIDENPNRTLYFPDGVYLLGKPILTPAAPKKSVSLSLSAYAILRATDDWSSEEAMVRLGAKEAANDIKTVGSNYYFEGGIIDGCGRANGISIDGGRETVIRDVSIKHTRVGVHVKRGANAGSSDADVSGVNIVGTGGVDSIGLLVEGWDNTFTKMRIANVFIGVDVYSAGNQFRAIHPLYTSDYTDYENSCGFRVAESNNWFLNCYSDQFANGFRTTESARCVLDSCFSWWYSPREGKHVAFRADKQFCSLVKDMTMGGNHGTETEVHVLLVGAEGGHGSIERVLADPSTITGHGHEPYMQGEFVY